MKKGSKKSHTPDAPVKKLEDSLDSFKRMGHYIED